MVLAPAQHVDDEPKRNGRNTFLLPVDLAVLAKSDGYVMCTSDKVMTVLIMSIETTKAWINIGQAHLS